MPRVTGILARLALSFRLQDFHLLRFTFQGNSTSPSLHPACTVRPANIPLPDPATPVRLHCIGLGSSLFARATQGISSISLLLLLRCFSSQGSLPFRDTRCLYLVGFPIRASALLRSLAPTRGFSQLATPFFASRYLGILREPFYLYLLSSFDSLLLLPSLCTCQ